MSTWQCPKCPHTRTDHGTFGCLHGWERARYSESIIQGCRCNHRAGLDRLL
jgi:hypothetical protein